jgi:hypothetical protein
MTTIVARQDTNAIPLVVIVWQDNWIKIAVTIYNNENMYTKRMYK